MLPSPPSPPPLPLTSHSFSPLTPPTPSVSASIPPSLSTPSTLHTAITFSQHVLIFTYSRQTSSTCSQAYKSFVALAQQHAGRKHDVAFYVVCVEDVCRQDVPLVFGRLGVLPSCVRAAGSAVSLQRGGRLWRCAVGKGGGLAGIEALLREVRGGSSLF